MNPAKLRRSRDVSELQWSKIEKRFRQLAMFQHGLDFESRRHLPHREFRSEGQRQLARFAKWKPYATDAEVC
jgi:hypothetical protein